MPLCDASMQKKEKKEKKRKEKREIKRASTSDLVNTHLIVFMDNVGD
jgi:hypothetical protein